MDAKSTPHKDTCMSMFIAALFPTAKKMVDGWLDEGNVVHVHNGALFS